MIQTSDYRKLLAFARRLAPSAEEACDLVHEALIAYLDGRREWVPEQIAFVPFIYGAMRSIRSNRAKRQRREPAPVDFDSVPLASGAHSPEDEFGIEQEGVFVTDVLRAHVAHDEDLVAFWEAIENGSTKRSDIADTLGWSSARVTAVRLRLQRHLIAHNPKLKGLVAQRSKREPSKEKNNMTNQADVSIGSIDDLKCDECQRPCPNLVWPDGKIVNLIECNHDGSFVVHPPPVAPASQRPTVEDVTHAAQ